MGTIVRSLAALLLTASVGASMVGAHAQTLSLPRQLTLPPPAEFNQLDVDGNGIDSGSPDEGAASVLPNRRSCATDVMILGRPLAGADMPKLKGARPTQTGVSPACQISSADTNPAPILVAPPNGVQAPVTPYTAAARNDAVRIVAGP